MARKIKQYRFFDIGDNNHNSPSNLTYQGLLSGMAFTGCYPILQLGVQGLPGTKFYVNNSVDPIIIGNTGIFELDLGGKTEVNDLCFHASSLQAIIDNDSAYLIVDIVYEED